MTVLTKIFMVFLFALLIVFNSGAAFAAEEKKPVKIESDSMEYFKDKKKSIFVGNVITVQGKTVIKSEKMEVFFDDNRKAKEIFFYGNVKIDDEAMTSLSEKAHMIMATDTMILTGNVKIWRDGDYMEGDRVVFRKGGKEVDAKSNDNKRVKMLIKQ